VENIGLGVDHYGLNKFGSRTADYSRIRLKLVELLATKPLPSWDSVPFHTVSSYTAREELSSKIREKLRVKFEDGTCPCYTRARRSGEDPVGTPVRRGSQEGVWAHLLD
jgi:hypothetical protein